MMDLERICKLGSVGVVGAPDQNHVDESHAGYQWKDASGHDFILAEEALVAHVAASKSGSNDDDGEGGAPPAVEEGRVVGDAGTALRWCIVVE